MHRLIADSQFETYNQRQVVSVAQAAQKVLRDAGSDQPIYLAGSFVNGRALPTSDVDFFSPHMDLNAAIKDRLHQAVGNALASSKLGRLPVSLQTLSPERISQMSDPAPVMLRITADHVDLLVYPPQRFAGYGPPELVTGEPTVIPFR